MFDLMFDLPVWAKLRYLADMNVSAHRFFFYFYGFFRPLAERVERRA
jgi:hypothetical protein